MSYRQLLLAGSLLLPLANASEPEPALADTAESSVVTPSSAASSAIAPGATAGDNRQQLWLRPLGNIKSGDINQLQLDEHVLQYAPNGQVRVVDAQLQPLAGELRQLPPPLVQQALTIIALDEAAYSDIDNAVAEEAISVALQEQALIVQLRQQRQPSSQRWLLRSQLLSGTIEQLELDWHGLGQQLHSVQINGSSDLQQWQPLLTATLEPGQQQQKLRLNSGRLRYLLLTLDSGPQVQLRSATLQVRPATSNPRLWAAAHATGQGQSWQLQPPATPADDLRYASSGLFAATIRLSTQPSSNGAGNGWQQRWAIHQSTEHSAASHALQLPPGSGPLLLESSAPLPAGQWQWGWQPAPYLFLATAEGPYYLAYGALPAAEQTTLGPLLNGRDSQLNRASLGAPETRWLTPPPQPLPWRHWLLIASLWLAALLVIGLAVSQWRRLNPVASSNDSATPPQEPRS